MKYLNRKFQQGGSVQQDPQQVMQQVASALQQGAKPEDVMKALVGKGIPKEQAAQMVQAIMQQMQGTPSAKQGAKLEMVKKLQMKQRGGKAIGKAIGKVNGREVPNDGADYSVQPPANKSEMVKKPGAVKPSNNTAAKTKKELVPLKKQKGGYMQKGKSSMNTAAADTKKLPKMNAQSGANSSTVPTNPDGSMKTAKKQGGGDFIDPYIDPYTKKPYSKEIVAAARARVEGWKKDKENKPRIIPTPKVGLKVKPTTTPESFSQKKQNGGNVYINPETKKPYSKGAVTMFEGWKKDKENKPRIIPTPKVGLKVKPVATPNSDPLKKQTLKNGGKPKAKKCLKGCGCGTKLHKEGGVISTVCSCCGTICN